MSRSNKLMWINMVLGDSNVKLFILCTGHTGNSIEINIQLDRKQKDKPNHKMQKNGLINVNENDCKQKVMCMARWVF